TKSTILKYFTRSATSHHEGSYLIDPHTAVGFCASNRRASGSVHQVVLSTAHPAKFAEAVTGALEAARDVQWDFERDVLPKEMRGLLQRERRCRDVKLPQGSGGKVERLAQATREVVEEQAQSMKMAKEAPTQSL
ncbi:hypothetical protein FA09DRAFT_339337, partial [Tilletiopsis washingtonensis]